MTPEEKKALIAAKLDKPAAPVVTQVVPVETKPAKEAEAHFNVYIPTSWGEALGEIKVKEKISYKDQLKEAVEMYLRSKGKIQ